MKHIFFRCLFRGLQICLACCALSFANPVYVPPLPPLSEINIESDNFWTVEIDCRKFTLLKRPCLTDTFTLFCSQSSAIPPKTSMQKCVTYEGVDSNGLAYLTYSQFPQVKLTKGWYVTLGLKGQTETDTVWQAHIPDTLKMPFSIISKYTINSCCTVTGPGECNGCAVLTYIPSCPSIGTINDSAFGSITGQVLGSDSLPLANIDVFTTADTSRGYLTDKNGVFLIKKLDNCHTYSLRFLISAKLWIDTTVGPVKVSIGHTSALNVRLNYRIPTNIMTPAGNMESKNKINFFQIGQRIVLSVMPPMRGKGTVEIFSTNGRCVRSLPVDFSESGTYTIKWDGRNDRHAPVVPGKYGCRVQLNGETACSGFIIK
jgi:hypothetical protein